MKGRFRGRAAMTKGGRLPALERNILKYRALEMVMMLFHVEELKEFVLTSIQATDRLRDQDKQRLPKGAKNIYAKAWNVLVDDGILTQAESHEIRNLVDYRNDIAHQIYQLIYDLGHTPISHDYVKFFGVKYDYRALKKVKEYRAKIGRRFRSKYVMTISFDSMLFEAAEKTYLEELRGLNQKITRQFAKRKEEIKKKQESAFTSPVSR